MGRLFHNVGVAAENDLVPKVANMRPLGRSKTREGCNLNEYAEQDLMLTKLLMTLGDMPCMALKVITVEPSNSNSEGKLKTVLVSGEFKLLG